MKKPNYKNRNMNVKKILAGIEETLKIKVKGLDKEIIVSKLNLLFMLGELNALHEAMKK